MDSYSNWNKRCVDGDVHNGSLVVPTIYTVIEEFKDEYGEKTIERIVEDMYFLGMDGTPCSLEVQVNCAVDCTSLFKELALEYVNKIYGKEAVLGVNLVQTLNPLRYAVPGCANWNDDKNPVKMRIHIQSLKMDIEMTYYQVSKLFEVQCKPLKECKFVNKEAKFRCGCHDSTFIQ